MWDLVSTRGVSKKFYRKEPSPFRTIGFRLMIILIMVLSVALFFWVFERSGIEDTHDGKFSFIDSIYFTIVTVTTLGYGDIVPTSESARLFDAIIITPVRIIVWVLFIGTAYQFVIQNQWERFRMNQAIKKLHNHVIIAGFGTTGAVTVDELIRNGYDQDSLIVVDNNEERVKTAADKGTTGILGDPSREETLTKARVENAQVLIVTTSQDDTNVLITLTAKDLNPRLKIISRVSQMENIKQLKRAGADVIISPSLTSGHLMALAVSKSNSVELIEDLLTTSRGANVLQRGVKASEIGLAPKKVKKCVVLGVVRGGKCMGPRELDEVKLKKDDEIIYVG